MQTLADASFFRFAHTLGSDGKVTQTDVTDPRGFVRRLTVNAARYPLTDTQAVLPGLEWVTSPSIPLPKACR